ncbi:hypothetical protein AVEN_186513-1 [Araneus ventricosus]|uniref:Uncharacterized protein n=1 Tax=Araneus ventricosus TaxID=182803 RepID=A0A4Y2N660_ARAVE|nr:hypothetical protein AVEN_186513-1 [Araneus ventricosus]
MNEERKKFRNVGVKKGLQNGNTKKKFKWGNVGEEQEYEERKPKEVYEERKRKDEIEFKLQKIRLGAEGRFSYSVSNQNVNSTQIKPKLELHHLMQKLNSDEHYISLYFIMFEHLTKQDEILEKLG